MRLLNKWTNEYDEASKLKNEKEESLSLKDKAFSYKPLFDTYNYDKLKLLAK
jgi:hypothetical protein